MKSIAGIFVTDCNRAASVEKAVNGFKCTATCHLTRSFSHNDCIDTTLENLNVSLDTQESGTEVPIQPRKLTSKFPCHTNDYAVKSSCAWTSLTENHTTAVNIKSIINRFSPV